MPGSPALGAVLPRQSLNRPAVAAIKCSTILIRLHYVRHFIGPR